MGGTQASKLIQSNKLMDTESIGETLYESFVRKRTLVKYQSQSEVIARWCSSFTLETTVKILKIQILKLLNFNNSNF